MSKFINDSPVFIMDSGPFLDIIPTLLDFLDLKSRIQLARTCRFWKYRIYTDLKRWPKTIQLPYLGCMDTYVGVHNTLENVIDAKLWSMIRPPEDPKALEQVLQKMASSENSIRRFALTTNVDFKNFLHTDESLRLTALLFPSIEQISLEGNLISIVGIRRIATSCKKLKHIEFYQCHTIDLQNACRLFNTEEYQQNLERIFIYQGFWSKYSVKLPSKVDLPFMALCQRCGLYFNESKNDREMLCLHHPGTYNGFGHSCSSFDCCGSNTPRYSSTLGCQYTFHQKCISTEKKHYFELHDGLPENMFQKYPDVKFSFRCTERRRLDKCYKRWNQELKQDE
ncbi:hypothetical protein I4U23_015422 [Adineta vaga]|nr:hypothetical protein I4U23_015422 [Adineta vaga]